MKVTNGEVMSCDVQAVRIAQSGRCPSPHWKDAIAPLLAPRSNLHFLNAGANKGFAVAEFLQRFHAPFPSSSAWESNITSIKGNTLLSCGYCRDCRLPQPASRHHVPSVRIHAFELLEGNAKLLSILFDRFKVPGAVHTKALSNSSGYVFRPTAYRTGQENAFASFVRHPYSAPIHSVTIDDFATAHSIDRLDWLLLDAEGWDLLILQGAAQMLASKRITIVEFEYSHNKNNAAEFGATLATRLAHELRHYTCFWQGGRAATASSTGVVDKLAKVDRTASCFSQAYGNVVCSHEPAIVAQLLALT